MMRYVVVQVHECMTLGRLVVSMMYLMMQKYVGVVLPSSCQQPKRVRVLHPASDFPQCSICLPQQVANHSPMRTGVLLRVSDRWVLLHFCRGTCATCHTPQSLSRRRSTACCITAPMRRERSLSGTCFAAHHAPGWPK
jgi:hypothetical protein